MKKPLCQITIKDLLETLHPGEGDGADATAEGEFARIREFSLAQVIEAEGDEYGDDLDDFYRQAAYARFTQVRH